MKTGTVALVVSSNHGIPTLVSVLTEDREITIFENALEEGAVDPLELVFKARAKQQKEDEEFGVYVENLLSQPFVRPEIKEHGVQWLKSKIRIEEFQKNETEACRIIADYAFELFSKNPRRQDFTLAGPTAKVRVKVLLMESSHDHSGLKSSIA